MTPKIRDAFVQGMSRAVQTVTVVTTDGVAGRAGLTLSTMVSVSADGDHPTLLICVKHTAQAAPRIIGNGVFCVNMLRGDQMQIADVFAGRFAEQYADKFAVAEWALMPFGTPRLIDPLVGFECRLTQNLRIGTHHIFVGAVQSVYLPPQGPALIYADRAYAKLADTDPALFSTEAALQSGSSSKSS
jgi:flavin reductase (DIM6/NTAB) family NADH-FMN oxidoreductase RutF